jgi:hypothetical protein
MATVVIARCNRVVYHAHIAGSTFNHGKKPIAPVNIFGDEQISIGIVLFCFIPNPVKGLNFPLAIQWLVAKFSQFF